MTNATPPRAAGFPVAQPTTTPPVATPPSAPPRLAAPDKYSGDSGDCRSFLVQCDLHFKHYPGAYQSEQAKVAFMISHLTGRAAAWATAEWARESVICADAIFDHKSPAREASWAWLKLRHGSRRVVDYAIDLRRLATDSGWNGPALNNAFIHSLSDELKDQMAPLDLPPDLEIIISTAIRIEGFVKGNRTGGGRGLIGPSFGSDHGEIPRAPLVSSESWPFPLLHCHLLEPRSPCK